MKTLASHQWFREKWEPKFQLGVWHFESGVSINVFGLWVKLPIYPKNDPKDICDMWGLTYCDRSLHVAFGGQSKIFWMPWDFAHIEHLVENERGDMVKADEKSYAPPYADGRNIMKAPYSYTLKNGEVQNRIATFYVSSREWRWRIFAKLPFRFGPKIYRKSIWVDFDGEVGERTGSWKGGTTGCGYDMTKGETALQALRRMEIERKFT